MQVFSESLRSALGSLEFAAPVLRDKRRSFVRVGRAEPACWPGTAIPHGRPRTREGRSGAKEPRSGLTAAGDRALPDAGNRPALMLRRRAAPSSGPHRRWLETSAASRPRSRLTHQRPAAPVGEHQGTAAEASAPRRGPLRESGPACYAAVDEHDRPPHHHRHRPCHCDRHRHYGQRKRERPGGRLARRREHSDQRSRR